MTKKQQTVNPDKEDRLSEDTYLLEKGEPVLNGQPSDKLAQLVVSLRPIKAIKFTTPGVKSHGPYQRDTVYAVGDTVGGNVLTNVEAHRLINVKGFIEAEG